MRLTGITMTDCQLSDLYPSIIFHSDYDKVERFDSGTYAEVFRGKSKRHNSVVVFKVIRSIPKSLPRKVREISFSGSENYDDVLNEIIIIE